MTEPLLSIVVPCYNEEENIAALAEAISNALKDERMEYEVVLVDDGSTDGTYAVMCEARKNDARIRLIRLDKNAGETAATDCGIRSARGRYVITIDADLQCDPLDIPMLLAKVRDDGFDMACGSRVKSRKDTWLRRISSRIANGVRNWLSEEDISDSGCTLRAFKRECLESIKLYRGMHRFLPTLFRIEGYSVCEVPVRHHPRHAGTSKYGVWNRVFRAFADLLAVRWMKKRRLNYTVKERK
jgi:glycosyltransferase involved in cell wall biosynthesis